MEEEHNRTILQLSRVFKDTLPQPQINTNTFFWQLPINQLKKKKKDITQQKAMVAFLLLAHKVSSERRLSE